MWLPKQVAFKQGNRKFEELMLKPIFFAAGHIVFPCLNRARLWWGGESHWMVGLWCDHTDPRVNVQRESEIKSA